MGRISNVAYAVFIVIDFNYLTTQNNNDNKACTMCSLFSLCRWTLLSYCVVVTSKNPIFIYKHFTFLYLKYINHEALIFLFVNFLLYRKAHRKPLSSVNATKSPIRMKCFVSISGQFVLSSTVTIRFSTHVNGWLIMNIKPICFLCRCMLWLLWAIELVFRCVINLLAFCCCSAYSYQFDIHSISLFRINAMHIDTKISLVIVNQLNGAEV